MLALPAIIFGLSLIGLWFGAELVIRGALSMAHKLKLSETFVGLTILALGTSLPESIVSVTGAAEQLAGMSTSEIVIGNIVGSALAQIGFIMGLAGVFHALHLKRREVRRGGLIMIATVVAFWLVAVDGVITRLEGMGLLLGYLVYLWELRTISRASKQHRRVRVETKFSWISSALLLLVGFGTLFIFSRQVIAQGEIIARILGVSETIIGLFLVAIGTSLPELVVSVTAIIKGSDGMSVGNVIGSNITILLVALGSSAALGEWQVGKLMINFDIPYLLLLSILFYLFLLSREKLEHRESWVMLAAYGLYTFVRMSGVFAAS